MVSKVSWMTMPILDLTAKMANCLTNSGNLSFIHHNWNSFSCDNSNEVLVFYLPTALKCVEFQTLVNRLRIEEVCLQSLNIVM